MQKTKGTLVIILAVPPVETLIQLLDSILKSDQRLSILVHLSNQYNRNETLTEVSNKLNSNRLNFMPKSIPTDWGKITYALVETLNYAYQNLSFSHIVLLPFNCLPIRKNISSFLKENNEIDIFLNPRFKIFRHIIIENEIKVDWNSGKYLWESRISRLLLRRYFNGKNYWGGNFEGIVIKKAILKHLIMEKFLFRIFKNNYSLMFEEVYFPTILVELSKRYNFKIYNDQLCYVDWEKSKWIFNPLLHKYEHKVETGNVERICEVLEQNQSAFFYKWVSTDVNDSNRKALINFINNKNCIDNGN